MPVVGRISEVWRYAVKSMGGERLQRCEVGPCGVVGDRGWALGAQKAGEIRGAKKLPGLLRCAARYLSEPEVGAIPPAEITLPGGARLHSDDPAAATRLSDLLGRAVTLWPRQPETATDHYRRAAPDNPDFMAELRAIFGRTADEPLPDLSVFPPEIMEYTSPLGTYFDAFPVHLLTTASLAKLQRDNTSARFDVRRFRPNFLIDTAADVAGLIETTWSGKTLHIGTAKIKVEMPCLRCLMTPLPQGDLPADASVLRTIVRDAAQNLGAYGTVVIAGTIAVGDVVELE